MRIRTIKPEFWKHFGMSQRPAETRLLAIGLLNFADDEGYFNAHPALIRGELMPFDEKTKHIPPMLEALERIGYIELTKAADGMPLGKITNFVKHQRINRPTASKHSRKPHASLTESSVSPHDSLKHNSALERNREQGREEEQGFLLAPDGAEPLADDPEGSTTDTPDGSGEKKKRGAAVEDLAWAPDTGWTGFTDWLAKEQDRGGDLRGQTPFQAFTDGFGAKKEAPPLTVELPPEGYEQAMVALWGADWQETMPGWPQMVTSDKAQVRRWLAQHGKGDA